MKAITQKDLARLKEVGTYHQAILITSNECEHQPIIQWLGKAVDPSKLISRLDNGLLVTIDGIAIQAWNVLLICPVAAAKKTFLSVGMSRCLHIVPTELLENKESTDYNLYFCIDTVKNRLESYFHPDNAVLYGATGGIQRSTIDNLIRLNRSSYRNRCSLGSFIVNIRYEQIINASLLRWMRCESCCDTEGDEVTKNLYRALFAIVNPEQPTPPPLVAEAEAPIRCDGTAILGASSASSDSSDRPIDYWGEWREMLERYVAADDATFPIQHFVGMDDIRDANHATDEVAP